MKLFVPALISVLLASSSTCLAESPWQVASMDRPSESSPRYTRRQADAADEFTTPHNQQQQEEARPEHSVAHKVLLYIPNRVVDFVDIFRLRVRVGPGVAVGARATKYVQAYFGSYGALYAGLPGARRRVMPRSPIGLETNTGITVSVLDATIDGGFGPEYSPTEIGAGVHLAVVGVDVGIDPWEIVDFVAGIFTLGVRDDDF